MLYSHVVRPDILCGRFSASVPVAADQRIVNSGDKYETGDKSKESHTIRKWKFDLRDDKIVLFFWKGKISRKIRQNEGSME